MTQLLGQSMPTSLAKIAQERLKQTANQKSWLSKKRLNIPQGVSWPVEISNQKRYNSYLLNRLKNRPVRTENYIKAIANRISQSDDWQNELNNFTAYSSLSKSDRTELEFYFQEKVTAKKIAQTPNVNQFSQKSIKATEIILAKNLDNLENPYIEKILEYIQQKLDNNKPLELSVVNCLRRYNYDKTALPALIRWNLEGKKTLLDGDLTFFDPDPISIKGWKEIKDLIENLEQIEIELKPTIYLGDTDFYFLDMDNFRLWAENYEVLEAIFENQIQSVRESIQTKANKYFDGRVDVQRLSEISEVANFKPFLDNFEKTIAAQDYPKVDELIQIRTKDYNEIWEVKKILQDYGLDENLADELIKKEAQKIVAQYAFESENYPGLIGIAESSKDTFFSFNSQDPLGTNPKPAFILNRRKS